MVCVCLFCLNATLVTSDWAWRWSREPCSLLKSLSGGRALHATSSLPLISSLFYSSPLSSPLIPSPLLSFALFLESPLPSLSSPVYNYLLSSPVFSSPLLSSPVFSSPWTIEKGTWFSSAVIPVYPGARPLVSHWVQRRELFTDTCRVPCVLCTFAEYYVYSVHSQSTLLCLLLSLVSTA